MKTFSVKNWDTFQHYKNRRPIWIKLYNDLLDDYHFNCLPDASRWQLVAIWLLASRYENRIPADAEWLQKTTQSAEPFDLQILSDKGFITIESDVLADCQQNACLEKRESKRREEKNPPVSPPRGGTSESSSRWTRQKVLKSPPYEKFPLFEEFWALSKTGSKAAALWKWIEYDLEGTESDLKGAWIRMVENYRTKGLNPPHVSTWLNQRRWEDTYDDEPSVGRANRARELGRAWSNGEKAG